MIKVQIHNNETGEFKRFGSLPDDYHCSDFFCDNCGDCIHCFPDSCPDGQHLVVINEDKSGKLSHRIGSYYSNHAPTAPLDSESK